MATLAQFGDLSGYARQIQRLGGCERRTRPPKRATPLPDPDTVLVLSHWRFAGTGLTAAETWLATSRRPDTPDPE
ncbi:hypothetical protein [Streptomyces sp. NPDC001381]|uniref:hypothetical protein n=1 Tax=Streptomyces sp. NPDC001381 TaxID=3364567 RepID=UPI0036A1EE9E